MKKLTTYCCIPVALALFFILSFSAKIVGQSLPESWRFSADGKRLVANGQSVSGYYNESNIHKVELWFAQANYWTLLTQNYQSSTDIPATMIIDGDTLASPVGVHFKGQTSYSMVQGQKKSFSISMNFVDAEQSYKGYNSLNLNNCFDDPSFVREVLYLHQSRLHTPSLKGNFAQLFINGQNWGLYPSAQQLDGDFIKEWFLSNDGTRWRALRTDASGGPGGPGGGPFGTGVCSLNYLGADTALYKPKYTLKNTKKEHPWEDLRNTCAALNNPPLAVLQDSVRQYLDLDKTLWFLATEILFSDDDGYVHKGGMDYYIYWEPESGRIVPLEFDGNTVMKTQNQNWSPFYRETDTRFPLMNRLMAVPELRQRYLAHVRTLLEESFDPTEIGARIDAYYAQIDSFVKNDPKKLYTYNQFLSEKQVLKNFVSTRRNLYLNNAEVKTVGLEISDAEFSDPKAGETTTVTCAVSGAAGVSTVRLYFATGFTGNFDRTEMFDDGQHGDGAAGDGTFGGTIPGFDKHTWVRFYVEAIANDAAKTATYQPKGAEHDVYVYKVGFPQVVQREVVINEIMADNANTAADPQGQNADWIELYNTSDVAVDLSGWFLSDNADNLPKYKFPTGTSIPAKGYLIVWADEDDETDALHANFKLSAGGETLWLLDRDTNIVQEVIFGEQQEDLGYARQPNGTGDFVIKPPTFGANNDTSVGTDAPGAVVPELHVFPNPASTQITVLSSETANLPLEIFNLTGQRVLATELAGGMAELEIGHFAPGVYLVRVGAAVRKVVVE